MPCGHGMVSAAANKEPLLAASTELADVPQ